MDVDDDGVTLRGELRRGVNAFNLGVGTVLGAVAGGFVLISFGRDSAGLAALAGFCVFAFTTAVHTAAHAYYGWRLEHGIDASRQGEHARAVALLGVVERRGIDHYDERGAARRALATSRAAMNPAHGAPP